MSQKKEYGPEDMDGVVELIQALMVVDVERVEITRHYAPWNAILGGPMLATDLYNVRADFSESEEAG